MPLTAILARFVVTVESATYSKLPHEASGVKVVVVAGGHNYEGLSSETAAEIITALREAALDVLRGLEQIQDLEGPESGEARLTEVEPTASEVLSERRKDIAALRMAREFH